MEACNLRLSKARNLLLEGDLEPDDYRAIKLESEKLIARLEAKLTANTTSVPRIEPLLDSTFANISKLDVLYDSTTTEQKRKMIGSIFPEKLIFDGSEVRTTRINEALNLMLLINKKFKTKKNSPNQSISDWTVM